MIETAQPAPDTVGIRLRGLREAKGLSRRELAEKLKVDVTSISGWEAGKHLPREHLRSLLAKALGMEPAVLFGDQMHGIAGPMHTAAIVDTVGALPGLLGELTPKARRMCVARLAAPHITISRFLTGWRKTVADAIAKRAFEVEVIEIIYDLNRLQEILSNVYRYDGYSYLVKSYCPGLSEPAPGFSVYSFDDAEFLLQGFWRRGIPSPDRLTIRLSGTPFTRFFRQYWEDAWGGGTLLNPQGANNLSAIQKLAFQLGLPGGNWDSFVNAAKQMQIGDGAPPLA